MATHSSILAWRMLCAEEPGGLQSMGSQRVGQDVLLFIWKKVSRKKSISVNQQLTSTSSGKSCIKVV